MHSPIMEIFSRRWFSVDSHATIINVNMGHCRDAMGEGSRYEVLNQWKKKVAAEDTQALLGGISVIETTIYNGKDEKYCIFVQQFSGTTISNIIFLQQHQLFFSTSPINTNHPISIQINISCNENKCSFNPSIKYFYLYD